ncbi:MAG: GNAT family N-acetyltransferase [Thermoplasmata archaeon]|nr:MAG: GNAT family N-acetyltransferase [Thermoplasmata archaeon]
MKIEENIEYFKRSRLPWIWWIGPSSKPKDLGKHLVDYGFIHRYDMPGMVIELQTNSVSVSTPEKFNIIRVKDIDTLKIWVKIASICFPMVIGKFKDDFFKFESSIGFRNDRISYVGYLEGEPVASSTVFLCSGVAGIYNVGTVPEARRKGIGTAMTWIPLKHAVSSGYKVGILHSSRMGYRLYRKMGFNRCCMIGNYMWQPEVL